MTLVQPCERLSIIACSGPGAKIRCTDVGGGLNQATPDIEVVPANRRADPGRERTKADPGSDQCLGLIAVSEYLMPGYCRA